MLISVMNYGIVIRPHEFECKFNNWYSGRQPLLSFVDTLERQSYHQVAEHILGQFQKTDDNKLTTIASATNQKSIRLLRTKMKHCYVRNGFANNLPG